MSSQAALYAACAEVLQLCQPHKGDLDFLFSREHGFATRMQAVCQERIHEIEQDPETDPEELDGIRMELHTWSLLQSLEAIRRVESSLPPSPAALLAQNPYTPQQTLEQAAMDRSRTWTELAAVREWLQETAPQPHVLDASTGYWRLTLRRAEHRARFGVAGGASGRLDPDVETREGTKIAPEDAAEDRALLQTLFAYVRNGELDAAYELCVRANQPWRAASVRGALLFTWPALSTLPADREIGPAEWEGNRRRSLWLSTAVRAATNPTVPEPERVLYAALAPCYATQRVLSSACHTWEDHLWARTCVLIEERRSALFQSLGGSFWERGLAALDQEPAEDLGEEDWAGEVAKALEDLSSITVQDGLPADHPFHISQLYIIQNITGTLLNEFANQLEKKAFDTSSPEYTSMTRFFAHLSLFLQMIDDKDAKESSLATQKILEAYLSVLESAGQRALIAIYAGALGDNAVNRYALFLSSLDLSVNAETRRVTLADAAHHGLDITLVAAETAQLTIAQALKELEHSALKGLLPDPSKTSDAVTTESEERLRRSLEWTSFLEETDETALENANVILRYFLAIGKVEVARRVLREHQLKLPDAHRTPALMEEFQQYFKFFDVWETLARAQECAAIEAPHMTRDTHAAWLRDYKGLVEQARQLIVGLFRMEWMVVLDDEEDEENADSLNEHERRDKYFSRIRRIYVPELLLRLHALLLDSRHYIPENVKHAIKLSTVVADSRFKMDRAFGAEDGGRPLKVYLEAVRNAVLISLENGGSDPFSVVA
ncbi:nuclear pore protein 84/107 [Vararia minispora EC-137]|uniref:Nuclear pore protein 84/107 n=1 Tax=Vararia minispora EC-137 TaxID=1314806 RepID=A0ACB8QI17_9AGAM|nr:nuclear pore protein 84/107 [Vararia minispora EC-137]